MAEALPRPAVAALPETTPTSRFGVWAQQVVAATVTRAGRAIGLRIHAFPRAENEGLDGKQGHIAVEMDGRSERLDAATQRMAAAFQVGVFEIQRIIRVGEQR